jgi:DinB superfamily
MIPTAELRDLLPKAAEVAARLSHAEFNWRPAEGAWSIAECLAHLNTTDEIYCTRIAEAISSGISGEGPFELGWLETRFIRLLEPPYRMRFKAPTEFRPSPEHNVDHVLDTWRRTRLRLLDLAAKSEGLHLTRLRVASPVSKFLKFSVLGAFHVVVAHDRRHLWQAAQVRKLLPKTKFTSAAE